MTEDFRFRGGVGFFQCFEGGGDAALVGRGDCYVGGGFEAGFCHGIADSWVYG